MNYNEDSPTKNISGLCFFTVEFGQKNQRIDITFTYYSNRNYYKNQKEFIQSHSMTLSKNKKKEGKNRGKEE